MSLSRPARWILAVALALAASPLAAQSRVTAADVSGTVLDASSAPLPGVSVTLTNVQTNVSRTLITDSHGRYMAAALQPGTYRVAVSLTGFGEQKREPVTLTLGQQANIDFTMGVGGRQESVTVTVEAPVVEVTRTVVSSTVTQTQIENLPSNGRNYIDFALITPGVGASSVGSRLMFTGQRGQSNNVTVDGFDNNDQSVNGVRVIFSQEAIREFQVLTNSYSAEYGKASGGVLNVVSKSGTNKFDGSAFLYYRNDALNTKEYFQRYRRFDLDGNPVGDPLGVAKADFSQKQWGASLGGPLKRDKTFFFLAFERTDTAGSNFVNIDPAAVQALGRAGYGVETGAAPENDFLNTYLAKVDHHWNSNHTLVVRGQYATFQDETGFGGITARSGGNVVIKKDWSVSAFQTSILGRKLVNEARLLYAKQDYDINALDPTCNGPCDQLLEGNPRLAITNVATVGVGNFPQPRFNSRIQFVDTLSYLSGSHSAKVGVDYNRVRNIANTLPISFAGAYTFSNLASLVAGAPLSYTQAFGNPSGHYPLDDIGLFIQDDWRITRRFVVKAGLRYQRQYWMDLFYDQTTPAGGPRYSYSPPPDTNNFAPRLAASWDATGDGKTSLHAAYGLFHDYNFSGPIAITDGDRPRGTGRRSYTLTGAAAAAAFASPGHRIAEPTTGASPNVVAIPEDYQTPYSHQVSVGVDRALTNDLGLSVNLISVRGKHYQATLAYNPLIAGAAAGRRVNDTPCSAVSATCVAAAVAPGSFAPALGVRGSSGSITEYKSYAQTWYKGLTVSLNKRLSRKHQFQVSYTLAKQENLSDDYLLGPEFNGYGRNPNDLLALPVGFDPLYDRGPGLGDQRHNLVVSGLYQARWGILVSTVVSAASGRPFNIVTNTDFNLNGTLNDRARSNPADPATEIGRNTGLTTGTLNVNARLSKRFKLSNDMAIEGIFEVFNLFDRPAFSNLTIDNNFGPGVYPTNPVATYGQYTTAGAPRQMQLAARFIF